jgi:probable HAF family extracellular repeat protein
LNNGTFTTLSVPGALPHTTDAVAINDSGQIVGFFTDSTGNHGFLYTNGVFTTLPGLATGINNEGQIVGVVSLLGDCNCGFLDTNGVFSTIDFPGSLATEPLGINSAGQIVGSVYFNNFGNVSSFIDTNGRFTRITLPFSYLFDEGQGINDSSQIVGSYFTATGGHGFLDSNGVFSSINVPFLGAYGTYAYGINDSGQIVGLFTTNTSTPLNGFLDTGGVYTTIDQWQRGNCRDFSL